MKHCIFFFAFAFVLTSCSTFRKEINVHRDAYKAEFLVDERSPLDSIGVLDLDFFQPNKSARVEAKFQHTPQAKPFELLTYSGITKTYRQYGVAAFVWEKDSVELALYESIRLKGNPLYSDYLFLPFKDETNGTDTYGGGRYLNMSKTDTEDGMITIDFNLCYNPWCAYSDGYNCPIPPKKNHLSFRVEAGEKNFAGTYRKRDTDH